MRLAEACKIQTATHCRTLIALIKVQGCRSQEHVVPVEACKQGLKWICQEVCVPEASCRGRALVMTAFLGKGFVLQGAPGRRGGALEKLSGEGVTCT